MLGYLLITQTFYVIATVISKVVFISTIGNSFSTKYGLTSCSF